MSTYFLGIDDHTDSLRTEVCEINGRSLSEYAVPYAIDFPILSNTKQNLGAWWGVSQISTQMPIYFIQNAGHLAHRVRPNLAAAIFSSRHVKAETA
jgi:hypothetical protein